MPASRARVRGAARARATGALKLSAVTTGTRRRRRWRTSGAATPTATAPHASVLRAREDRTSGEATERGSMICTSTGHSSANVSASCAAADVLAPVHRHRHAGLDPARRLGRLLGRHHVGAADGQQRHVGAGDGVHLGDHVGVAGVVEPLAAHVQVVAHEARRRGGGRPCRRGRASTCCRRPRRPPRCPRTAPAPAPARARSRSPGPSRARPRRPGATSQVWSPDSRSTSCGLKWS